MSSLRLALKMSIEESKTPDISETKSVFPKTHTKSTSERVTTTGGNKQPTSSTKRKKNDLQLDEKNKLIKNEDENLSEAETEDSLKLTSDQDDSNLGIPFTKKAKTTHEKKKKVTPPDQKKVTPPDQQQQSSGERSLEHYDAVESLIASRQTPPIGTSTSTSVNTPTPSKKASKERPKTPVIPPKSSKHEKLILPILPPTESPQPPIKQENEASLSMHSSSEVDLTQRMELLIPEPVKIVPIAAVEASKEDSDLGHEPKVENESLSPKEPPKEPFPEDKVEDHTPSTQESAALPPTFGPEPEESKKPVASHESAERDLINEKIDLSKKVAGNKKKRKGFSDPNEAEESGHNTAGELHKVEEPDDASETVRAPSRAAAMAAKSKINNNSKVKTGPEIEPKKVEETPMQAPPPELPPQAAILKAQWVACDKCSKWRRIPGDIDLSSLPEEWYCTMNIWDPLHNDCSHVEEEYVEKEDEEPLPPAPLPTQVGPPAKKTKSSKAASKAGGKRGRKPVVKETENHPAPTAPVPAAHADSDDEGEGYMGTRRRRGRGGSIPNSDPIDSVEVSGQLAGYALPPNATFEKVHWVQCGKCSKWRKVPGRVHEEGLPDIWYCAMNTWAIEYSRCSAKEEEDDTISLPANLVGRVFVDPRGGVGRGRYVRKTRPADSAGSVVLNSIRPWVQCERKNCKKWRKLPAHVDVETLPEKWYCEMNSWDPERATCDASEETDSESEHPANAATRSQLILGNSKGPGTLSYRRLIFGTDGRIRPFYSERNKNGYGLFSYTEVFRPNDDEYVMPTRKVSYWWSSAYQDSGTSFTTSTKIKKTKEIPCSSSSSLPLSGGNRYESSLHPLQTQHLLDSVLRLSQPSCSSSLVPTVPPPVPATKWSKMANEGKKLTLLSRISFSCQIIRLALVSSPEGLTLDEIFDKIMAMYFLNSDMESCRNSLGLQEIKETLYRLEQNGEIEVTYNNNGSLLFRFIFQLLPPQIPASSSCSSSTNPYPEILSSADHPFMEGKSRPLKMRKRKFKGTFDSPGAITSSSSSSGSSVLMEQGICRQDTVAGVPISSLSAPSYDSLEG